MDIVDAKGEFKNRGILLFSNRKYLFALGTFLINIKKSITYDGVIVYHDDFTIDEQVALKKIEPKIKFIKYGIDEFVKEFGLDINDMKSCSFIRNYTALAVVKFKIFKHLEEFSTMILFDVDMLLLDSMEELLENDYDIAWRNGGITIRDGLRRRGFKDQFFRTLGMYDFYSNTIIPNGGFVVVKRSFDYRKAYELGVWYLTNVSFKHPYHIDEILLAYIKDKMHLNACYVDKNIYNVWPNDVSLRAKLVHFMGDFKPWNHQIVQMVFKEWRINYEQCVALTGIESPEVIDYSDVSKCLLQAYCFEKWNELFYKYGFVYPRGLRFEPKLTSFELVFTFYGFITYRIELDQWAGACYCSCWLDKDNRNIPQRVFMEKVRSLAINNSSFLNCIENKAGFGVKTIGVSLPNVPKTFYTLYDMTEGLRKIPMMRFAEVKTYHGSKIYLDLAKNVLTNSTEMSGVEVFAGINGEKISLFINRGQVNVYISEINKEGMVSLVGQQTFFSCINNQDMSISIDVKDGSFLSADRNGKVTLSHWNREWEHFTLKTVGTC